MALIITSLSPVSGTVNVTSGTSQIFVAQITEDQYPTFVVDSVQWEVSTNNGVTWGIAPFASTDLTDFLDGTYSSTYNTGILTNPSDGDQYRIVVNSSSGASLTSSVYTINVVTNPSIIVVSETYNPFYIVPDNGTVVLEAAASYLNRSVSSPTDLNSLTITWQKSFNYDPNNPTSATWTNISAGTVLNEATYAITETTFIYDVPTSSYAKNSQLTISSIKFGLNDVYVRPLYTSTGVSNSPTEGTTTFFIVNPTISIITQPGIASNNTKDTAFCYSVGNPSNGVFSTDPGGDFRSSISAVTSAASSSTLTYRWEYRAINDGFSGDLNENLSNSPGSNPWDIVSEFSSDFILVQNDSTLIVRRLQYKDRYQFRCVVTGTIGEPEVISNIHEIYVKDNITNPNPISTPIITLEDFYGNVVNRELLTDKPIRNLSISGIINIANYLGQQGNMEFQWERRDPGGSTWSTIGTPEYISYLRPEGTASAPATLDEEYISTYVTVPLRIDDGAGNQRDDGSSYRLRFRSSSVYSYNSAASYPLRKTLTSWYSNIVTLDVYKEIFITAQPSSITSFPTSTVSFSTNFDVTSNISGIQYKWQRVNSTLNQPNLSTLVDVTDGPLFGVPGENVVSGSSGTGTTSSSIVITNITSQLSNLFFRTIISDSGALSSVTSDFARVSVTEDRFTQISSINDYFVSEFSDISWEVTASTLSQGAITYQWQKSTNYGQSSVTTIWTNLVNSGNIQGVNTNTLSISSVQNPEDVGYYRLKLTSTGGTVAYSNVVRLAISLVEINITQNLPNTFTFIEGETITTPFKITAFSSNGEEISYKWQYKKPGDVNFVDFGPGQDFQSDISNPYTPNPFLKQNNWDGAEIRVRLSIPSFAAGTFIDSNVATLDIKRRFFYFADSSTKTISIGDPFSLNLLSSYTGNSVPTFSWEYSANSGSTWSSVSNLGAVSNSELLFVPSVLASYDNYLFRCLITLTSVDQLVYTRNNVVNITNVTGSGYTATVTLNAVTGEVFPVNYTQENSKTGCAVGTVICIPKPAGYADQSQTAVNDDIDQWEVSISGDPYSTGTVSSLASSGNIYNTNKNVLQSKGYTTENWIDSSYKSPKWRIDKDRFPGFIELRGQWLLKSEFPLLYAIIGNAYGSTTTAFKLPNPYGKKLMGTGAVNSQNGRTSVIPLFNSDGTSGGDRLIPGTIGGVWNYDRSRQLPPGSPNVSGESDGTAGTLDPATFTLGNYSTVGWDQAEGQVDTSFTGSFSYLVGPVGESFIATPAPHTHTGSSVRGTGGRRAATSCSFSPELNPVFTPANESSGSLDSGPTYIDSASRGRGHSHGINDSFVSAGVNPTANHGNGAGDTTAPLEWTDTVAMEFRPGDDSGKTLNSFLDQTTVTMSNASKTNFDNNLKFYVRNSESIPIISNYYRVKWMIKAY